MIHLIGPDGTEYGPFRDRREAQRAGEKNWPDAICGDRDEDPGAWEIRISTKDRD